MNDCATWAAGRLLMWHTVCFNVQEVFHFRIQKLAKWMHIEKSGEWKKHFWRRESESSRGVRMWKYKFGSFVFLNHEAGEIRHKCPLWIKECSKWTITLKWFANTAYVQMDNDISVTFQRIVVIKCTHIFEPGMSQAYLVLIIKTCIS